MRYNKKLDENEKIISVLKSENTKLKLEVEKLLIKNKINKKKLSEKIQELYVLQSVVDAKKKEISELLSKLSAANIEKNKLQKTIDQLREQLEELKRIDTKADEFSKRDSISVGLQKELVNIEISNNRIPILQQDTLFIENENTDQNYEKDQKDDDINKNLGEVSSTNFLRKKREIDEKKWIAKMKELEKKESYRYWIVLRNPCSVNIHVILHFYDLDSNWVTRGIYNVAPGANLTPDIYSVAGNFYYYAYCEYNNKKWFWKGDNDLDSISELISSISFTRFLRSDKLEDLPDVTTVKFKKANVSSWGEYLLTFGCPY